MKSLLLAFSTILVFSFPIQAQEKQENDEFQSLFGNNKIVYGGYGGPQIGFSKFDNRNIILVGGHGGVVINHFLVIGGAGSGIVNMLKYNNINGTDNAYLVGGYGGMYLNFIAYPLKVVHVSFPMLIGAGGMEFVKDINQPHENITNTIDNDVFFVFEPGVEIELNVLKFMRFGIGAKYRWAPNLNLINTSSDPFNGISYCLSMKFGKF